MDAFIDGLLDSEIRYTLLKEDPDTFNSSAQRAIALEATAKVENARFQPRRTGDARWTQGDDEENGRKAEVRDLSTNMGMGLDGKSDQEFQQIVGTARTSHANHGKNFIYTEPVFNRTCSSP